MGIDQTKSQAVVGIERHRPTGVWINDYILKCKTSSVIHMDGMTYGSMCGQINS